MVAAFNSATGSKEARESLSEASRGFRECTEVSYEPEVNVLGSIFGEIYLLDVNSHVGLHAAHVLA